MERELDGTPSGPKRQQDPGRPATEPRVIELAKDRLGFAPLPGAQPGWHAPRLDEEFAGATPLAPVEPTPVTIGEPADLDRRDNPEALGEPAASSRKTSSRRANQSHDPLLYPAQRASLMRFKRRTGFEPATSSLGSSRSTY